MWSRLHLLATLLWAQDTLYLTISEAERQFLQKNLSLIAQHLQIESQKALAWQARLWPNPSFTAEQVDIFTKAEAALPPFLSQPRVNQVALTLSQTILTARKRLKGVALANAEVTLKEAALEELLRQLRYELRSTIATLQREQILIQLLVGEASFLHQLVEQYRALMEKGLIPLSDYFRLQNLHFRIQADLRGVRERWEAAQHTLRQLLQISPPAPIIWVDTTGFFVGSLPNLPPLNILLPCAQERGDVRIAAAQVRIQAASLSVERASAYPDIDFRIMYDRLGGYRLNQWGIGLAFPLPLFNRNQGKITALTYNLRVAELEYEQTLLRAQSEITQVWRKALNLQEQWQKMPHDVVSQYQQATAIYRENLLSGRVSLNDFLNFSQSSREMLTQYVDMQLAAKLLEDELKYVTAGKNCDSAIGESHPKN
ncbi:MAG: TolC family protein [Bacteroidia bacterium]|nr:TolC family protein [Bacteroidia bacterium]MCX7652124.1 TolC family protein [Bacteroidia bacterium]MDW8416927.1 TolC family protein [Bacteroidia bacterium]